MVKQRIFRVLAGCEMGWFGCELYGAKSQMANGGLSVDLLGGGCRDDDVREVQ